MARGVRWARWCTEVVATLACLGSGTSAFGAQTAQGCAPEVYATIDLVVAEDVYVPVAINGHAGVMSLDLASAVSSLDERKVADLGLLTSTGASVAHFRSFHVGQLDFGNGSFRVSRDTARPGPAGVTNFGVLGTEPFGLVDFELDLSRARLNLFSQDHCVGSGVYWADTWGTAPLLTGRTGTIYFPIELEGRKVEATLATTEPFALLRTDASKRLYGLDETSPGTQTSPPSSASPVRYRRMALTGSGMALKDARVVLASPPAASCSLRVREGGAVGYESCDGVYPFALGRDVLTRLRLYVATKEKKLHFTAANATIAVKPRTQATSPPK